MAEKEMDSSTSSHSLVCPLCLDIFDDATLLTCGHTFCRRCLKRYDAAHPDLDHVVCPLCRESTVFEENRVDGLATNVTVNGLVDELHGMSGGDNAILEMKLRCTVCRLQEEAVSFCSTCSRYMCQKCQTCHEHMRELFEGHEIIYMKDILDGKVSILHRPEKCPKHKQENKDMFCDDCSSHICLKCVVTDHRDHKIKNLDDFEKELQQKVRCFSQRCMNKKTEMEKNIESIEARRREINDAVEKLRANVNEAYVAKAKQLKENQRVLTEEIDSLQKGFNADLDSLKSRDRQRIKSIVSSMSLVDNDRLGRLETDSLAAHTLLCDELDGLLEEATDHTSVLAIKENAQKTTFKPADNAHIDLGKISELHPDQVKDGNACTSDVATAEKPNMRVIKTVNLPVGLWMLGITKYSDDSVAIGYLTRNGVDIIDSAGHIQQYPNAPNDMECYDLVFQKDMTLLVSHGFTDVKTYSSRGFRKSHIHITSSGYNLSLNRSPSDEILIANGCNRVYIYDPNGSTLRYTVPTKQNRSMQVSATRSGLIVTSSCCTSNTSVVTVYDRDGNAGNSLIGPSGDYLYADVDDQDKVYVARISEKYCRMQITLYELEGLNLKETVKFKEQKLTLPSPYCYLVCLSPEMLALASREKLYFLTITL